MTPNLAARLAAELRRDNELASHLWDDLVAGGTQWCMRAGCGATWPAGAEEPRGECPERR